MKKKLMAIKQSPIVRLTFGSIAGQLISIIVSPITTRLYTPEQLGIYTLLLTVVTLFGPVLSGKIEMAIVTEKEEKNMYAVLVLSVFISVLFSLIVTILYMFYLIITNQFTTIYWLYIFIILIYMNITGLTNILVSYNNRNKDYNIISSVYIIRTTIQNLGLVLFGIIKFSVTGMLLAQVIGSLFGIKKQSEKIIPNLDKLKQVTKEDVREAFKRNYRMMIYTAPSTFCNSAAYSSINFFITAIYGATIFGYYSLSYRILGIPLSLISTNVSKVFFERASSEMNSTGGFNKTLKKITLLLLAISIPMVVSMEFLAPVVCKNVFGEEWIVAGQYIQILVFMFGIRLVVSALTPALVVSKKQELEIRMQIMFLISSVLTFIICKYLKLEITMFLTIITISYSIIYIIFYMLIYKLSKGKEVIKK